MQTLIIYASVYLGMQREELRSEMGDEEFSSILEAEQNRREWMDR
jgi:hypothetical protein